MRFDPVVIMITTRWHSFVTANKHEDPQTPERLRTYDKRDHTAWPHRIWLAMAATMTTPITFQPNLLGFWNNEQYSNLHLERANPAGELIEEAREVFGVHRRIGCLVSCGLGVSSESFDPESDHFRLDDVPKPLVDVMKQTTTAIEATDEITKSICETGSYFRFDPIEALTEGQAGRRRDWDETAVGEQWGKVTSLEEFAVEYMQTQSMKVRVCAGRLSSRIPSEH